MHACRLGPPHRGAEAASASPFSTSSLCLSAAHLTAQSSSSRAPPSLCSHQSVAPQAPLPAAVPASRTCTRTHRRTRAHAHTSYVPTTSDACSTCTRAMAPRLDRTRRCVCVHAGGRTGEQHRPHTLWRMGGLEQGLLRAAVAMRPKHGTARHGTALWCCHAGSRWMPAPCTMRPVNLTFKDDGGAPAP